MIDSAYRIVFTLLIIIMASSHGSLQAQEESINKAISQIEFKDDTLRSVIEWMSKAFTYDLSLVEKGNYQYDSREELIKTFLRSKKGVCEHFSLLFNAIATHLGYESYLVPGYLIDGERSSRAYSHQWNALVIDDEWYLYDPTWASGYVENGRYNKDFDREWIKVNPRTMLKSHIPFDPMWQLISQPIRHSDIKDSSDINLDSSVDLLTPAMVRGELNLPDKERLQRKIDRIEAAGITNALIKLHVNDAKRRVANLQEAASVDQINASIDAFNQIVQGFNTYLEYRTTIPGDSKKIKMYKSKLQELMADINKVDNDISGFYASSGSNKGQLKKVSNEISKIKKALDSEINWLSSLK